MELKYFKANPGFVFKRICDEYIMGSLLYLGKFIDGTEDSIDNYTQVEGEDEFINHITYNR